MEFGPTSKPASVSSQDFIAEIATVLLYLKKKHRLTSGLHEQAYREQETQLSLTNRATHLCKCSGVANLLKHAPARVCYHAD